jgi:hypothetical protein
MSQATPRRVSLAEARETPHGVGDNRSDAPAEPPTDPDVVLHSGELVAGRLTDQELKRSSAFRAGRASRGADPRPVQPRHG